ncbi:MAG TPA: hypothetical protein PLU50_09090, partial [Pseudobdellovibrionaceae bacterium]|nr:hypothetical protein [Pseudobdellovibrionaceae bacterium]
VSDILETQQAESLVDQELEALNREIHDFTKAGRIDSFEARYAIAIRILELSSREYFFGETVVRHLVKIQALMKDKDPQMKHVIDVHLEKLLKSPFGGVPLQIASAYFERIGKVLSLLKIANYETDSELNPVVWHLRDILDRSVDGIYRSFQKLPRALRTKAIFGFRTKILVAGHGEGFRALRDPEIKNEAYQDFEALSLVGLKNREVDLIKTWIRSLEFDSATHEYPLAQERIEVALEHLDSESFLAVMNVALSENMTVEFATTNEYLRYVVALTEMLNKLRLDPHFPLAKFKTGLAPALVSFEKRAESLFASKDGSIHPLTDSLLNRLYRNLRLLHDERIGQQMCLQILKSL